MSSKNNFAKRRIGAVEKIEEAINLLSKRNKDERIMIAELKDIVSRIEQTIIYRLK